MTPACESFCNSAPYWRTCLTILIYGGKMLLKHEFSNHSAVNGFFTRRRAVAINNKTVCNHSVWISAVLSNLIIT